MQYELGRAHTEPYQGGVLQLESLHLTLITPERQQWLDYVQISWISSQHADLSELVCKVASKLYAVECSFYTLLLQSLQRSCRFAGS